MYKITNSTEVKEEKESRKGKRRFKIVQISEYQERYLCISKEGMTTLQSDKRISAPEKKVEVTFNFVKVEFTEFIDKKTR